MQQLAIGAAHAQRRVRLPRAKPSRSPAGVRHPPFRRNAGCFKLGATVKPLGERFVAHRQLHHCRTGPIASFPSATRDRGAFPTASPATAPGGCCSRQPPVNFAPRPSVAVGVNFSTRGPRRSLRPSAAWASRRAWPAPRAPPKAARPAPGGRRPAGSSRTLAGSGGQGGGGGRGGSAAAAAAAGRGRRGGRGARFLKLRLEDPHPDPRRAGARIGTSPRSAPAASRATARIPGGSQDGSSLAQRRCQSGHQSRRPGRARRTTHTCPSASRPHLPVFADPPQRSCSARIAGCAAPHQPAAQSFDSPQVRYEAVATPLSYHPLPRPLGGRSVYADEAVLLARSERSEAIQSGILDS